MSRWIGLSFNIGLIITALHSWCIDQHTTMIDDIHNNTEFAFRWATVDDRNTTNFNEIFALFLRVWSFLGLGDVDDGVVIRLI